MSNDLEKAFDTFVDFVKGGLLILPPEPNTLGQLAPDLSALKRDELNIIGQVQTDGSLDSGDSAHRTGVLAFCNSKQDQDLLPEFEIDGIMRRHPTHEPWNNWKNSSRDQLIGYLAGCWRANRTDIAVRLLAAHQSRVPPLTCQNTEADVPGSTKKVPIGDPLGPHSAMYLRICAGVPNAFLDPVGQFSLQLAIQFSDKDFEKEPNQLLLHSIVCGRLNFYCDQYPDYSDRLRNYWAGWRQQPQIAEALISVVNIELRRYEGQILPSLLPQETIQFLSDLDVQEEITNIDPAHHAAVALAFAEAIHSDAQNAAKQTYQTAKAAVEAVVPDGIPKPHIPNPLDPNPLNHLPPPPDLRKIKRLRLPKKIF